MSLLRKFALAALACCAMGAPTANDSRVSVPLYPTTTFTAADAATIGPSATRAQNTLYPRPAMHAAAHNGTQSAVTGSLGPTASASGVPTQRPMAAAGNPLRLLLKNNLDGNKAHAYFSALDSNGKVVMLTPNGNFYYPSDPGGQAPRNISADIAIPLPPKGQSLDITIPGYVEGARVWFAEGKLDFAVVGTQDGPALVEPTAINPDDASADINWGFVELTWISGYGLFANLSFVDFVGMPLAMQLETKSSATQVVKGMPKDAVQQVCEKLRRHRGVDRKSWANLCVAGSSGEALRVISPSALLSQQPSAFANFFRRYIDQVWERYSSSPLMIDTQGAAGKVACTTGGRDALQCEGDQRGFAKPSAGDIFGCNTGPFAIQQTDNAVHKAVVPRLCAAFHRGTLLMQGGHEQPRLPPSDYYSARPSNWYSKFVHEIELDGRGYAFAYDDVAPNVQDEVSGAVAAGDPRLLTVFVGGMAA